MSETPFVEFPFGNKNMARVRICGKITFTVDGKVKEKIIAGNELVRSIYQSLDKPIFKVFFVEHGSASISYFSGV